MVFSIFFEELVDSEFFEQNNNGFFIQFKAAVFITVFGSWLRYFCLYNFNSFTLLLIPTSFVALANPILTNGISKTAYRWFGDNEVRIFNLFIK